MGEVPALGSMGSAFSGERKVTKKRKYLYVASFDHQFVSVSVAGSNMYCLYMPDTYSVLNR